MSLFFRRLIGFSVGWFIAIAVVHLYADYDITLFVSHHFNPDGWWGQRLNEAVKLGLGLPYIVGFLVLYIWVRFVVFSRVWVKRILYMQFCVLVSAIICDAIKYIIWRPRPKKFLHHDYTQFTWWFDRPFHLASSHSFPSGHTTTAAAVGIAVAFLFPKWRWWGIGFMVLIATLRVVLLLHFVTDVMAGMYLGGVCSLLLYRYYYTQPSTSRWLVYLEGARR